jgi:8-oxo-dGTP pyrophosphatase MutT (NUDIX family)
LVLWRLFLFLTVTTYPVFDPSQVPITSIDTHLPKVSEAALLPDTLRQRFFSPPQWLPEMVSESRFSDKEPTAASVLIPLVMRDQLMVLLTQRAAHLSSHSGQIAFPGGKADATDTDAAHTALREAEEEIGLQSAQIEVIGALPTYTTGSAYVVTPVVGLVNPSARLAMNANEVADVFEVPLRFLMDPANHRHHTFDWAGAKRHWLSMPYQEVAQERFIWGATAGMLRNLYRFLLT